MSGIVAKYQRYAEYKDSDVEWLGEIPSHWTHTNLKHYLINVIAGGTPDSSNEKYWTDSGSGIPWVSIADMTKSFNISKTKKDITAQGLAIKNLTLVPSGTILYSIFASLGKVAVAKVPLVTNQAILGVLPKNNLLNDYLIYWLQYLEPFLSLFSTSNTQDNLNAEKVGNLPLFAPYSIEQTQIANFLDHETAKIDSLIEKQQQLIQLLKEKRQAVISHAVTKGLNPDVPMKDSGVEWLGEVPEHWELMPLKYLCSFSGGGTPSKDNLSYWTDGDIPWVSPKDMKTFWIKETQDYITEKAVKESSTNIIEPNSLLMVVRSGILQRTIPIAINQVPVTMNQDMKALKFGNRVLVEYIADLIQGHTKELLLEWSKEGATVESIEHEYLANSIVPLPSVEEQQSITALVSRKNDVYRELTYKAESQILLLQERRTALISAAVTGKIDVRNWQNPNKNTEAKMEFSA